MIIFGTDVTDKEC